MDFRFILCGEQNFYQTAIMENTEMMPMEAYENLKRLTEKWSSKYTSFKRLSHERGISYFTYLRFHLIYVVCCAQLIG